MAAARMNRYIVRDGLIALRTASPRRAAAPLPGHPGAHAAAEPDHAARALRGPDRRSPRHRGQARMGGGGDRVRRHARRHRRPRRAHAQGHVALRRRARQPRRLLQFRRRAGPDPLLLAGPARARQCRLDRRHGVRDLRGPAARPFQRDDRRPEPAGLGRELLCRDAGARRRHRRRCCRSTSRSSACRRSACWRRSCSSTRWRSRS